MKLILLKFMTLKFRKKMDVSTTECQNSFLIPGNMAYDFCSIFRPRIYTANSGVHRRLWCQILHFVILVVLKTWKYISFVSFFHPFNRTFKSWNSWDPQKIPVFPIFFPQHSMNDIYCHISIKITLVTAAWKEC